LSGYVYSNIDQFARNLQSAILRAISRFFMELVPILNATRPYRVITAPQYGRYGQPIRYHFEYSPNPPPGGIVVVPPQRTIAVFAQELGGKKWKIPKYAKRLKLVLKARERARKPEYEVEPGILIVPRARPSPPRPPGRFLNRIVRKATPKLGAYIVEEIRRSTPPPKFRRIR